MTADPLFAFDILAPQRVVAGDNVLVEDPLPFVTAIRGGCAAARFRLRGDRRWGHAEAAHATIRRAVVVTFAEDIPSPRAVTAPTPLTFERFLSGPGSLPSAMFDTPYPSRVPRRERRKQARAWVFELLGATPPPDRIEVYAWSVPPTGHDAWFDSGREWWGTHWWTVAWADADAIVGITASNTD